MVEGTRHHCFIKHSLRNGRFLLYLDDVLLTNCFLKEDSRFHYYHEYHYNNVGGMNIVFTAQKEENKSKKMCPTFFDSYCYDIYISSLSGEMCKLEEKLPQAFKMYIYLYNMIHFILVMYSF